MRLRAFALVLLALSLAGCGRAGWIDKARLLAADQRPEEWLTTGRDFGKSHYSPLTDINTDTAGRLGLAWSYRTGTDRGLEATPIVVDGVMYTSGVAGRVYALDAGTGRQIWKFEPKVDLQVVRGTCCDQVNRGVAVWKGKVYVAALDGVLYALDAKDGSVVWKADTIVDHKRGYSSTGAPQVAGDVVVIGNAGAESDARGYITAYDLETGQQAWRFFTVPGDPNKPYEHPEMAMAAKTWDKNSAWEFGGGGPAWDGMAYDPNLNLLYVGTGNGEVWPRARRSPSGGDNLFVCSILAINPSTGRLVWYYQETPGDEWDFDAVQPMILTELKIGGQDRDVLMHASKNGFFYILDRKTGQVISAEKYAHVNWATHVDLKTGRPVIDLAAADYTTGPKLIFPAGIGAHNWQPMAYNPGTGLVYIPAEEAGNVLYADPNPAPHRDGVMQPGVKNFFSSQLGTPETLPPDIRAIDNPQGLLKGAPDYRMRSFVRAWDPVQHKVAWEVEIPGWWDRPGILTTAGGLVIHGSVSGHLQVRDAKTGAVLKDIDTGTSIMAAPMTYKLGGVQYVAVMAAWGGGGWSIAHPETAAYQFGNQGRILVFKLDGGPTPKPARLPDPDPFPAPPAQSADAATIARGEALFHADCGSCHTNMTRSGAPDLRRMSAATHTGFKDIVLGGAYVAGGMPRWSDVLTPADADAIHAYLIDLGTKAYAGQQAVLKAGGKPGTQPEALHGL
jgi:quinohemoprotein ethanol dehydrogenase